MNQFPDTVLVETVQPRPSIAKPAVLPLVMQSPIPKTKRFRHILLVASLLAIVLCHGTHAEGQASKRPATSSNLNRWENTTRASEIDSRVKEHPEIDFWLNKDGKPADLQHACVSTKQEHRGRLVIWLMGYSPELFHFLADEGFHVMRVHYANGWFAKFGKEPPPPDPMTLGNIRLEAATGEDFSPLVDIPKPDGIQERVRQYLLWLEKQHPEGNWDQFLTRTSGDRAKAEVRWDRVVLSGASHGATTSARFAIHQKVDRVVMFCGPRDQYENWQALDSATPHERFFGFSHTLDTGWSGDHYCRSWQMLDLHRYGPIVDVDHATPPYSNSRRLVTSADVGKDEKRAHSCVTPGKASIADANGKPIHLPVWRYLFTHPAEQVGAPEPVDPSCQMDQRKEKP